MTAEIVPIGTLLVWGGAFVVVVVSVGGVLYLVVQRIGRAFAAVMTTLAGAISTVQRRQTTAPERTPLSAPPVVLPPTSTGDQPPSRRSRVSHLEPLGDAVAHGADGLAALAHRWVDAAGVDQSASSIRLRALAESIVLGLFWLCATGSDFELTYARLTGASGSISLAYASSGIGVSWLMALVIVANVGVGTAVWWPLAHAPGTTPLVAAQDEPRMRRVVGTFLITCAVAAVALGLAAQEEVDGIHDVIVWDTFYGVVSLCLVGALWLGGVIAPRLLSLGAAVVHGILWLVLAGLRVALRVGRGTPLPPPEPPASPPSASTRPLTRRSQTPDAATPETRREGPP